MAKNSTDEIVYIGRRAANVEFPKVEKLYDLLKGIAIPNECLIKARGQDYYLLTNQGMVYHVNAANGQKQAIIGERDQERLREIINSSYIVHVDLQDDLLIVRDFSRLYVINLTSNVNTLIDAGTTIFSNDVDSSIRVNDSVYDQVLEKYYGIEYKSNDLYDVTPGRKPEKLIDGPVMKIMVERSHLLYSKYEEEAVLYHLDLDTMTTQNFTGTFYVNNFDIQAGKGILLFLII